MKAAYKIPAIEPLNDLGHALPPSKIARKKHMSALRAAAQYRNPVGRVSSDTYFNTGLENTGIGIGFRERGEIT